MTADRKSDTFSIILSTLRNALPESTQSELERRSITILSDLVLLARCARSQCLITYSDAIKLRGHGNAKNGQWLDHAFSYGIQPLGFPDLTMLVVNKATRKPSLGAFKDGRTILSRIPFDDVFIEQKRCIWFLGYENFLGRLDEIPAERRLGRIQSPEPEIEREIARCVDNAINRVLGEGRETLRVGKTYPQSLSRAELMSVVQQLWIAQGGRCALTGTPFEVSLDGIKEDCVSLDRIDNAIGYAEGNVQLVTQFANRARGTLPVAEARLRLSQFR